MRHPDSRGERGDLAVLLDSAFFTWFALPLLICLSRICDVTIGTVRIISVSRGKKLLSSLLGFFEAFVWVVAITQIMRNLDNPVAYVAYAAGFALGNYIGIAIEERMAMGEVVVRIITRRDATELLAHLQQAGYGVTYVDAQGATGPVSIIYTIIKRGALPDVHHIIRRFNPRAFYSVEDVRSVNAGVFPAPSTLPSRGRFSRIRRQPLGK